MAKDDAKEDDKKKPLPDDWYNRTVDILNEKLRGGGVCSRCRGKVILAQDTVSPIRWDGGVHLGGTTYPQAMLVCKACGHTEYYNLIALGIVQPSSGDDGDE
ncbi:MAG: hypothetical protein ACE5JZ_01725 [Kiloniellales bacterium]